MTTHRYTLQDLVNLPALSNVDGAELKIDRCSPDGHGLRVWLHEGDGPARVVVEERDPDHTPDPVPGHAAWRGRGRWVVAADYELDDDADQDTHDLTGEAPAG